MHNTSHTNSYSWQKLCNGLQFALISLIKLNLLLISNHQVCKYTIENNFDFLKHDIIFPENYLL